jgi:hypothetical protein
MIWTSCTNETTGGSLNSQPTKQPRAMAARISIEGCYGGESKCYQLCCSRRCNLPGADGGMKAFVLNGKDGGGVKWREVWREEFLCGD